MPAATTAARLKNKGYNTVTAGISNRKYDEICTYSADEGFYS